MIILGIETSCDDTAAALLEVKGGKFKLLKNITASQAKLHAKYQGVVPEVAARKHLEAMVPVLNEVLAGFHPTPTLPLVRGGRRTSCPPPLLKGELEGVLDVIAVTTGPGLITSLLIGVETAKSLSFAWDVPLVKVNHIEGHVYSVLLPSPLRGEGRVRSGKRRSPNPHPTLSLEGRGDIRFPAIALIVSGGHTELILMSAPGGSASGGKNHGQYKLLGRTRDDAAGETFDKAAVLLGLPYPGGPEISKRAAKGNPAAFNLPRPMLKQGLEFSFSGLKNAIRLLITELCRGKTCLAPTDTNDLSASIEQAIVDVLVYKSLAAVTKYKPKTFILAGGVAANKKLRQSLSDGLPKSINFLMPSPEFCQDNAAMIAAAGYWQARGKKFIKYDKLKAEANWELV